MPLLKFLFQIGDAVAFADQKYKKVVDKVGGLVDHPFIIPFHGLDDGLDASSPTFCAILGVPALNSDVV